MPRNLVICCDGTNNQFGPENTSVVRLVQALDRDPHRQRLYYDPGVGTLPEPGLYTRLAKNISLLFGLAFGAGLTDKVEEAYAYLMDIWEPGDQVYLFGFSRGAYTVRVLAGMLHALGLLPRGCNNMLPYVMRLFKAIRSADTSGKRDAQKEYWDLCDEFRMTFARSIHGDDGDRRFPIHFLGVWDTVSSVGWVLEPKKFQYTSHNPGIAIIRHAVSVDERRSFFRQNLMGPVGFQDFQQLWFPGVHADVGGGYPEADGGLWREPFQWIVNEAHKAGLTLDLPRLDIVLNRMVPPARAWLEPQHESLTPLWWLAEFFPKLPYWPGRLRWPRIGLGRHRHIPQGELLHKSTLLRIREKPGYAPPNFSQPFLEKIRGLTVVPETMPFEALKKVLTQSCQ